MRLMQNKIFRRIIYAIYSRIKPMVMDYEAKLTKVAKERKELEWENLFGGKSKLQFELKEGLSIYLPIHSEISKIIYRGTYEKKEIAFVRKLLKQGDYFIDAGANIGLFTLHAADVVGETGRVFSFEPFTPTFHKLQENILLNKFGNVVAFNQGLSDKSGKLSMQISENGYDAWNSFHLRNDEKFTANAEVEVTTLEDAFEPEIFSKINLIKIDVEGWEKFVLLGGKNYLQAYSPVVMVEFTEINTFNAGYYVYELFDLMKGWGYEWYEFGGNGLLKHIKKLHYPYENLIAAKDDKANLLSDME